MFDFENIKSRNLSFEKSSISKSAQQLVANLEHLHEASVIIIGADGAMNYLNSRAVDLFEIPDDISGRHTNFLELFGYLAQRGDFGTNDPAQLISLAQRSLNGEPELFEILSGTPLTLPSGKLLHVKVIQNTDNSIVLWCQDISSTQRKKNMLEMALDIGLAGYLISNVDGTGCKIESRYLTSLLTSEEFKKIQNQGPTALTHPDDMARSRELIDAVFKTKETQTGTFRIQTEKQGIRSLRISVMPETKTKRNGRIIVFFNDITANLRQQENFKQAKQLAEDSLRAKVEFLARMSHEVRTPMNAVIGMTDALIHHSADESMIPSLELIQKSATSTLKLLDETLTLSSTENDSFSLNPKTDNPADVVRDVCALWEHQALKNGAQINCVIKSTVPENIVFDKFRYEQCLNNLLSNAVKFTSNGTIDVVLTTMDKPGQPPCLVLAVRDTGIGMTDEQQAKIFEAYTQADETIARRFGGTGLGMTITKQIIESMGGTISVRSEMGSGTLFAIRIPIQMETATSTEAVFSGAAELVTQPAQTPLPSPKQPTEQPSEVSTPDRINTVAEITIAPDTTVAPTAPLAELAPVAPENSTEEAIAAENIAKEPSADISNPPQADTPNTNTIPINATSTGLIEQMLESSLPEATAYSTLNILVVDDNSTNHLVIQSLLGTLVASITVANNGREALDILDVTPIDIVLMDIHMPIMDGIECTIAIRGGNKPWKDVLIIALTADPQYQQKKLCKNIGMDEALGKPVRLKDLLEAIDTVLEKGNPETDAAPQDGQLAIA